MVWFIAIILIISDYNLIAFEINQPLNVTYHDIDSHGLPLHFKTDPHSLLGFCCKAMPYENIHGFLCAGNKKNMVSGSLDKNRKLVNNPSTPCPSINVEDWFDNNLTYTVEGRLADQDNSTKSFLFNTNSFYPLDTVQSGTYYLFNSGNGFNTTTYKDPIRGNPWSSGNYHNTLFCMETHAWFEYKTGDQLKIKGDDDLWVFVNNELVIDLGGVNTVSKNTEETLNMSSLGLQSDQSYTIDIFYCDRHTSVSTPIKIESDFVMTKLPKRRMEMVKVR